MSDKTKDAMGLRYEIELCQQMLNKGDIEGVKLYLGHRGGDERNLIDGMPFAERVRMWIDHTDGVFSHEDIFRFFGVNTTREKNNVRKVIEREKNDGKVVKVGDRAGIYRKSLDPLEELDWKNADTTPLELNFPLGIGEYFQPYPKNLGVIAGSKDAGKTAVLLDFVKRNQEKHDVHYYTNEMSKEELKVRISKRDDIEIKDWDFHVYECTGAYEDQIARFPNSIHVIDYIEVNDTFYLIGDYLKRIHEALDKGFVLVGLQKDWGASLGRGAAFSIQRPRLYITLERGYARCASAKNRTANCERSPVGDILYYGIVDGWKVIIKDFKYTYKGKDWKLYGWHPELPGEIDKYLGAKKGVYGGFGHGD